MTAVALFVLALLLAFACGVVLTAGAFLAGAVNREAGRSSTSPERGQA